jgi:hypothetical protein
MDPARMFTESLTQRPELENNQDPYQSLRSNARIRTLGTAPVSSLAQNEKP